MAPKNYKTAAAHDDSKAEGPTTKEKHSSGSGSHTNGKMRRVASSTGSNLREVTNASAAAEAVPTKQEAQNPGLQWNTFDRETLHAYRREHHLNTPTSFSCSYRQLVLSRPGGIGLQSPTMARKKENRRQSKEQLAMTVRKHFNGLGVQENDVIVDFIHKVRSHSITKADRSRRANPHDA
ncbi:unnamed protein product [Colletotrichum noveboracense]|uniref:Histone deacetylase complex subunit SAP30 Sin3 binding domain-containing protein n=1 Tax=Colletotrichum noveboracense TaxID=2664923 RepID=A0A9W4WGU5_9PEZI|nr:hypothetical protein K456DRAFT_47048 [Colletotrichum gloeosporioides 23]KAJ0289704.1 hypothetical protein COL940_001346 [Colletotrichum noveboracense]KAJ0294524.1 hypothetical protein CBS470a_000821 [Colletotrichum nupharicola]KAJ0324728.1 hypothetical protein Brms1b_000954 [Colletotrichum noveboracense]CAI0655692.1 unnamed protein product [Colletotrichum noveboracense]